MDLELHPPGCIKAISMVPLLHAWLLHRLVEVHAGWPDLCALPHPPLCSAASSHHGMHAQQDMRERCQRARCGPVGTDIGVEGSHPPLRVVVWCAVAPGQAGAAAPAQSCHCVPRAVTWAPPLLKLASVLMSRALDSGHTCAATRPATSASGTAPNARLSFDIGALSPCSQQWPAGTCSRPRASNGGSPALTDHPLLCRRRGKRQACMPCHALLGALHVINRVVRCGVVPQSAPDWHSHAFA